MHDLDPEVQRSTTPYVSTTFTYITR